MFNMILVLLLSFIMYVNADVFKYFNNVPHRCKEPVTGQWRDAWFYPDKCYYHNFTKNDILSKFYLHGRLTSLKVRHILSYSGCKFFHLDSKHFQSIKKCVHF